MFDVQRFIRLPSADESERFVMLESFVSLYMNDLFPGQLLDATAM
jgi:polyphosphate kinase